MQPLIAFIGGGNMASAIIGGLRKKNNDCEILVIEPHPPAREKLQRDFNITALDVPGPALARAELVVWAVKPQTMREAALACRPHTAHALHLSVAAGIRSDSMAQWLGTQRVIRCMPNTPALIGKGITGLYARDAVSSGERAQASAIISTTGACIWLDHEAQLDAVTAISGSGPAYMFYFMEAMTAAGEQMGLTHAQAYALSVATFIGAGELAHASSEPAQVLRERVTSKGGTTYAALTSMEDSGIKDRFIQALHAARDRAEELGAEFGNDAPAQQSPA